MEESPLGVTVLCVSQIPLDEGNLSPPPYIFLVFLTILFSFFSLLPHPAFFSQMFVNSHLKNSKEEVKPCSNHD